ncbi:MAG: UDP-2,3-diacylglucosamine diphosphatase LpxI [Pseudomonadota bacterium]
MKPTIGLIAGNGRLPIILAKSIRAAGHRVAAIGHLDETQKGLRYYVDALHWVPIGALGKIIDLLLQEGAQSAIFAGGVAKTHFFSRAQPDQRAIKVLNRLPDKKDDAILRAIAQEIESEGIRVESPVDFLQDSMAPRGCWTNRKPTEREQRDIEFGWKIAKSVGNLDLGQSIVVKDQMVLAVETIEGTDKTIRRGGKLGRGDVLAIKVVKPRQDFRLDLPVIGLSTMRTLKEAGASALAVEAQKTIVIDIEKVIREANKNHFCLIGI